MIASSSRFRSDLAAFRNEPMITAGAPSIAPSNAF
jgi:hypothetical protein